MSIKSKGGEKMVVEIHIYIHQDPSYSPITSGTGTWPNTTPNTTPWYGNDPICLNNTIPCNK